MSEKEDLLVDPNVAEVEILAQLPGLGEVMARRIVEARPYAKAGDMLRVRGLGKASLDRLVPYLLFDQELELSEKAEEPGGEGTGKEDEPTTEELGEEAERGVEAPKLEEVEPKVAPPTRVQRIAKDRRTYSRGTTLWLVLGTAVISVVISVLLSLAILSGINRTLNISQHSVVRQMATDLAALQADMNDVYSRMEALGRRIEVIEGLSGRVMTVEGEFSDLRNDIAESLEQLNSARTLIDDLESEVGILSESVGRFDAFLDGLEQLLIENSPVDEP
jgi:competence protein ComEA